MKSKLTLSIDEDLINFAHHEAKQTGVSVSASYSEFLRRRQTQSQRTSKKPSIDDINGILEGFTIDTSKAGIRQLYAEKYLNRS